MDGDIEVTYRVEPSDEADNLTEVGEKIAQEQSLGGYRWSLGGERAAEYAARPLAPTSMTKTITVHYPVANLLDEADPRLELPHLLNYVAGDVFGSTYVDAIKLIDVDFPEAVADWVQPPRFGIEGIHDRIGLAESEPLLGMILKPSLGLSPPEVRKLTARAFEAGVDVVKEDEKLVDPGYCRFEDRLDAAVEALDAVADDRERRPLYVLNVTGRIDAFEAFVRERGDDLGDLLRSFVLMATPISVGFGEFQRLARTDWPGGVRFPVYTHRSGHAAYTRGDHGIAMNVIERLSRLAGADFAHCGAVAGSHERDVDAVRRNAEALVTERHEWRRFPRCLPVVSGGVDPANVGENLAAIEDQGVDPLFMVGSSIYAHASGDLDRRLDAVAEGIAANRQAIEAARNGVSVDSVRKKSMEGYEQMREWLRREG